MTPSNEQARNPGKVSPVPSPERASASQSIRFAVSYDDDLEGASSALVALLASAPDSGDGDTRSDKDRLSRSPVGVVLLSDPAAEDSAA
jgi:hypothetical protein